MAGHRAPACRGGRQQGVSLLEVLIALALLGALAVATFERVGVARSGTRDAVFHARGTAELQELGVRMRLLRPAAHEWPSGPEWQSAPARPGAFQSPAPHETHAQWVEWLGQLGCHLPQAGVRTQVLADAGSGRRFWLFELRWRNARGEWVVQSTREPVVEPW